MILHNPSPHVIALIGALVGFLIPAAVGLWGCVLREGAAFDQVNTEPLRYSREWMKASARYTDAMILCGMVCTGAFQYSVLFCAAVYWTPC